MSNIGSGASTASSFTQQILQTAGFYPPTIYDLLTRFGSLQTTADPQSTEYLPMTDVVPGANSQTLPFIVGFLPPPLPTDRSASVAQNSNNSSPGTPLAGNNPGIAGGGGSTGTVGGHSISDNGASFIAAHEGNVLHVYNDALGLPTIGIGHLIQPGQDFSGGITDAQSQQLFQQDTAWMQNYINQNVHVPLTQNQFDALMSMTYGVGHIPSAILTPLNQGDYAAAAAAWPTTATGGKNSAGQIVPIAGMDVIRQNETNLFNTPDGSSYQYNRNVNQNPVNGDVQNSGLWNAKGGGAQSQQSAQINDSVANTSLNTTTLGQQFQSQQQQQATVLQTLINQMAQTPPLRMLVNPRSFKNSLEKITADGNWGRNGPIIEHWGEALDKIEGSGKIAAFYALDLNPPNINTTGDSSSSGPGLSRMARNYSASYQNFLSLYLTYRNNAGIWTEDYINQATGSGSASAQASVNLATVGSLYIFYDNILYVGSFDNFSISESDDTPFSLEYTFSFTVRAWFLLDQQQNPTLNFQPPAPSNPTGVQPQNGTVSTNSPISQFGASGGQPSAAQQQLSEIGAIPVGQVVGS
jgi:GH24 family phage-related lysozyme (muramidase)